MPILFEYHKIKVKKSLSIQTHTHTTVHTHTLRDQQAEKTKPDQPIRLKRCKQFDFASSRSTTQHPWANTKAQLMFSAFVDQYKQTTLNSANSNKVHCCNVPIGVHIRPIKSNYIVAEPIGVTTILHTVH